MKLNDIIKAQEKANMKYEVAKKIRQLLDDARKAYGPQQWDDEGVEEAALELVTDE